MSVGPLQVFKLNQVRSTGRGEMLLFKYRLKMRPLQIRVPFINIALFLYYKTYFALECSVKTYTTSQRFGHTHAFDVYSFSAMTIDIAIFFKASKLHINTNGIMQETKV